MVYKSYLGLRFPLEIYTTCVRVLLIFTLSYSPQIIYQFGTRRRSGPFVGEELNYRPLLCFHLCYLSSVFRFSTVLCFE